MILFADTCSSTCAVHPMVRLTANNAGQSSGGSPVRAARRPRNTRPSCEGCFGSMRGQFFEDDFADAKCQINKRPTHRFGDFAQKLRSRIFGPVDAMAETHDHIATGQPGPYPIAGKFDAPYLSEHVNHQSRRATVQRTRQGRNAARDCGTNVGPGRGNDRRAAGRRVDAAQTVSCAHRGRSRRPSLCHRCGLW